MWWSAGHTECVEVLLDAGSVVDAVTTSGSTALHSAASNGHAEVVQRLITAGADVDVQVAASVSDTTSVPLLCRPSSSCHDHTHAQCPNVMFSKQGCCTGML